MSEHDDVSWQLVEQVVRDTLGSDARLDEMCFLAGGVINTTLSIRTTDGRQAVLKISPHRANHDHEREGRELTMLRELGLPVPRVIASQMASLERPHSYLMLEHVGGVTLREAHAQCSPDEWAGVQHELAEHAAAMHATTGDRYGKLEGESFADWTSFYRSLVDPIWQEAQKLRCLPVKTRKHIAKVHERLDRYLVHGDVPRLCHGDLWGANILCHVNGDGRWHVAAIIDPELRHGHAEAEIAYMDLFKTITPEFKRAYQNHFRLAEQYHRVRKPIYQLYGLINYLQLHGSTHAPPVIAAVDKLAAIV